MSSRMGVRRIKRNRLMLVDNPDLFFRLLCASRDQPLTISTFKKAMESDLAHSIHIKTAHTYFYTGTTFGLLTAAPETFGKGFYVVSDAANRLCASRRKNQIEFQRALQSLLLTNPRKGLLFKRFLGFVREPVSVEKVYMKFEEPTGKTLIALSQEAGLVRVVGNLIVRTADRPKRKVTEDQFWHELLGTYNRLRRTDVLGAKRFFVPLSELRAQLSIKLDLREPEEFDSFLRRILDSEHGQTISLYGAPPHIAEKETFNYRGKHYVYLAIGI